MKRVAPDAEGSPLRNESGRKRAHVNGDDDEERKPCPSPPLEVAEATSAPSLAPATPRLEDWCLVSAQSTNPYEAPECVPLAFRGAVYQHPHIKDGHVITTSPVLWIDVGPERNAATRSRQYVLGKMEEGFRTFLLDRTDGKSTMLLRMEASDDEKHDSTITHRLFPNATRC